jgi:hypothetical protein
MPIVTERLVVAQVGVRPAAVRGTERDDLAGVRLAEWIGVAA